MEPKLFYVYYLVSSIDKKPFYVGKGTGNRMYIHERQALYWKTTTNPHLKRKILKILSDGGKILPLKIFQDLDEDKILAEEVYQIKTIGRDNLCNLTDGGEGFSGGTFKQSDYQKRIVSKLFSGPKTKEHRAKLSEVRRKNNFPSWSKGKTFSKEYRLKLSIARNKWKMTQEHKDNIRAAVLKRAHLIKGHLPGKDNPQARTYEIRIHGKDPQIIYSTLSNIAPQLNMKPKTLMETFSKKRVSRNGVSIRLHENIDESSKANKNP